MPTHRKDTVVTSPVDDQPPPAARTLPDGLFGAFLARPGRLSVAKTHHNLVAHALTALDSDGWLNEQPGDIVPVTARAWARAIDGASALDAWARTDIGRTEILAVLTGLAAVGWLRPGRGAAPTTAPCTDRRVHSPHRWHQTTTARQPTTIGPGPMRVTTIGPRICEGVKPGAEVAEQRCPRTDVHYRHDWRRPPALGQLTACPGITRDGQLDTLVDLVAQLDGRQRRQGAYLGRRVEEIAGSLRQISAAVQDIARNTTPTPTMIDYYVSRGGKEPAATVREGTPVLGPDGSTTLFVSTAADRRDEPDNPARVDCPACTGDPNEHPQPATSTAAAVAAQHDMLFGVDPAATRPGPLDGMVAFSRPWWQEPHRLVTAASKPGLIRFTPADPARAARAQLHQRVDNDHTYHRPTAEQTDQMDKLRGRARKLAHRLIEAVPTGRELDAALFALEQVVMQANAGIARQGGSDADEAGR